MGIFVLIGIMVGAFAFLLASIPSTFEENIITMSVPEPITDEELAEMEEP